MLQAALEDEASGSAGAGSPARKVQRERLTNHSVVPIKRPLADKNSADTVNSTAHEAEQAVVAVDPRNSKHQTTTGSALGFADNQQVAPSANSEQPSDGKGATAEKTGTELSNAPPTQRKSTKPDAQALRLQDQLLHQAFSSAPPALKVRVFPDRLCTLWSCLSPLAHNMETFMCERAETSEQVRH